MLPQRIWLHCCHLLLDNVSCKSHFAQAKDIERFLQDQPDFLETGNGGRPALKEAKMTETGTIICFFFSNFSTD